MAKILIVEDNVDLCSSVLAWLGHEHHTADGGHGGTEGHFRISARAITCRSPR
ncbi:MAG: hypothetical protein K2W95_17830 [Candidatus Obscuribacterales bacterium]|nr:hypothetical protein [Candidatus Obscuribacterales bacterium]